MVRKFIAVIENDKKQVVDQVVIFTKNHCFLEDVVPFYAEKYGMVIVERNKFGATLREIKEVEIDGDIIVIENTHNY